MYHITRANTYSVHTCDTWIWTNTLYSYYRHHLPIVRTIRMIHNYIYIQVYTYYIHVVGIYTYHLRTSTHLSTAGTVSITDTRTECQQICLQALRSAITCKRKSKIFHNLRSDIHLSICPSPPKAVTHFSAVLS